MGCGSLLHPPWVSQLTHRAGEEQLDKTGPSCSLLLLPSGRLEEASQESPGG